METEFGWHIYAYAVLIWFTIGSVVATALIWSSISWNPMTKLLFGYMSALLFTFFIIDDVMDFLIAHPVWLYGCLGIILICFSLVAARWRKPIESSC
jgi:hypothetical protein